MTAREELAQSIATNLDRMFGKREFGPATQDYELADALLAEGWGKLADAHAIIRDIADPDECWFDHHGGCQAHGYLGLKPGETCPQHDAKEWLKASEGSES